MERSLIISPETVFSKIQICIEDQYDIDTYIRFITYFIGAAGTFLVSFAVSTFLGRKVKTIDMVSSLKSNE